MSCTTRGPRKSRKTTSTRPVDHVGDVVLRDIDWLIPSPENDTIYAPVDVRKPANVTLTKSIKAEGVIDPIVTDRIGHVASGHRRLACARAAGLHQVPCRVLPILRDDDLDRWTYLLAEAAPAWVQPFAKPTAEDVATSSASSTRMPGNPTDEGNGRRFAHLQEGRALYCHPLGCWFVQDGRRWKTAAPGAPFRRG